MNQYAQLLWFDNHIDQSNDMEYILEASDMSSSAQNSILTDLVFIID